MIFNIKCKKQDDKGVIISVSGDTFSHFKKQVIENIKKGDEYFSGSAKVRVIDDKHITTNPNETKKDNLDNIKDC